MNLYSHSNQKLHRYVRDLSSQLNGALNSSETLTPTTPSDRSQQKFKNHKPLASYNDIFPNYRAKRQSAGREQLCQATYQYVTPQAALNSQGILLTASKRC